ncbi:transmembrane amino acid transporter protein [Chloropicon roscoffensis]|uniref:Transmembrane amino acid transporter protein n=1 Tax=Chloropicon roscoffensis TaxID=1461544 RepID=A0AAX4P4E9_9CHLO
MKSIGEEDIDRSEGTLSTTRSLPDQVTPERSAKRRLRWPLEGSRGSTLKSKSSESTTSWLHSSKQKSKSSEQPLNTDLSMVRLSRKTGIKLFPGQLEEDSSQFKNVVDLKRLNGLQAVDPVKEGEGEAMMRAPSRANTNVTNLGHMLSEQVFSCCVWRRGGSNQNTEGMTDSEIQKMPPSRTRWWQVTLYIINDAVGSWLVYFSPIILGMWGWVLGILILILMWPLNLYTAHLLWRCRNAFPGAISIGDLVFYVTRSSVAMYATFFFANLCILITLSNQMFTAASNIYYFFDRTYPELYGGMCFAGVSAIVVAILVPLTQIRYLHQLTPINILNVTCMLIFVVLAVYSLVLRGDVSPDHMVGPNTDALSLTWTNPGSLQASGPVLGFQVLFNGYYYQVLILEMMGEMKDPAEFPKANYWSTPVILGVTLTMAITQYYYLGGRQEIVDVTPVSVLESFFGTSNRRNPVAIAAIACFSVHMIGCCVIRSVVLTRSCLLLIAPKRANESNWGSRLAWTAISLVVLAVAWGLSTVIVTIAFTAWITTMLVIVVTFFIPIACYLVICKKRKALGRIPKLEVALLAFIVLFCLFVIVTEVVKEAIDPRIFVEIQNRTLLEIEAAYQCTDFQF